MIKHTHFGSLPAVELSNAAGARATITLFGAHVVDWTCAGGKQRLFCSALSAQDGTRSIRGGIPVIFPQFSGRGDGMRHGFARISVWRLVDSGEVEDICFAEFALGDGDPAGNATTAWPHAFALRLRVTLAADALNLVLDISNTGAEPFSFSGALHSYWLVRDVAQVAIDGLQRERFSDYSTAVMQSGVQDEARLRCNGKLDRIYHAIGSDILLDDGDSQLHLEQLGFSDAVVWNPGADDAAALTDMRDDEYRRFICIEAALVDMIVLAPGTQWQARHRINSIL
jgi:glucose-6-phosphate 1-epimerase